MIGLGIGVAWTFGKINRFVSNMILAFRARVYADGGVFEAPACLAAQLEELRKDQLLSSASFLVTPNAVEENKLFAIVPSSGAGDLDVVRATTATRVNSDGLIEECPYNLAKYSEQFDNSDWVKVATTVSANATIAPDGTLTADKLITTSANSSHIIYQTIGSIGDVRTLSCYVKKIDYRYVTIQYGTASCRFDFDTLTFTGGTNNGYEALPNGWYRIYTTLTATINARFNIFIPDNSGNISYIGDNTSGTFIWGAQLVTGTSAKEYFPTTDRLDVPRLDYTGGGCPAILTEPQRTNLIIQSEDFATGWSIEGLTVATNTINSPSGVLNADTVTETAVTDVHRIYRTPIAITTGSNYSYSVYVKKDTQRYFRLVINNSSVTTSWVAAQFDLDTATFTSGVGSTNGTFVSASITPIGGSGWYRCTLVGSITATTAFAFIALSNGTAIVNTDNRGCISYLGNVLNKLNLWGAQLEAGSEATSYIPTVAASVTRNWDTISKTGISSLINSVQGSFYVEASSAINGGIFRTFSLSDGTANNRLTIAWSSTADRLLAFMNLGGINAVSQDILSFNQTANNKILFVWGGGNFKVFINGINKLSLTSVTMPTANLFNRFGFDLGTNSSNFYGRTKAAMIFPTALTDAQGELLTGSSFYTYDEMAIALNYNIQ